MRLHLTHQAFQKDARNKPKWPRSFLSKEEIDQIIEDAQKYSGEDKAEKEFVEIKNNAEALIYEAQRKLQEDSELAKSEKASQIQSTIDALRSGLNSKDRSAITQLMSELQTLLQ